MNKNWIRIILLALVTVSAVNAFCILATATAAFGGFTAPYSTASPRLHHTATGLKDGRVLIAGGELGYETLKSAEIYDPVSRSFSAVGDMTIARQNHAATLLPDGRVLITGGAGYYYGGLASAEIFDPATGMFTPTGTMLDGHSGHTATLLPTGRVLIVGGGLSSYDAELYDPATGTFSATGNMIRRQGSGLTATLLLNGRVLFTGGTSDTSAELYDPATGTFSATGSMSVLRTDYTATLLENGTVLFAGGNDIGTADSRAELYDPATGQFSIIGSLVVRRHHHTATLLKSGKVLLAGGFYEGNAELYDPSTNSFSTTGPLTTQRYNQTATLLGDGTVLIVGGHGGDGKGLRAAERYDPATGTFVIPGSMAAPRAHHTATILADGRVLLAGGTNSLATSAELYDPATGLFTATGAMHESRYNHTATLLPDGRVLIAGGHDDRGSSYGHLRSFELYDPVTGTFSAGGAMMYDHYEHTATLLRSGKVLLAGGFGFSGVETYDPATNSSNAVSGMIISRWGHTASLLDNGTVLIAGGADTYGAVGSVELYDPVAETFSVIDGISLPRVRHTATPLPDGSILFVGGYYYFNGYGGNYYYTNAERFDPATATVADAGSIGVFLSEGHTASLLPSGKVLVAGSGLDNSSHNDAVIYDPATNVSLDAGRMVTGRSGHTATLLGAGTVLLAGGTSAAYGNPPLRSAELFSDVPQTVLSVATTYPYGGVDVWADRVDLTGSYGGTAPLTMIYNEGATVTLTAPAEAGYGISSFDAWSGCDRSDGATCTITMSGDRSVTATYTPPPEISVTIVPSPPGLSFRADGSTYTGAQTFSWPRGSSHTIAAEALQTVSGETLYFSSWSDGGAREHQIIVDAAMTVTLAYATRGFTTSGAMTTDRLLHTATLLPDGRVLVAGGMGNYTGHLRSAELYDPAAGTFTATGAMNQPRVGHSATLLPDGRVLMVGSYGAPASAELYDPPAGLFTATGSMVEGRINPTAVLLASGKVLVVGGENSQYRPMLSAELYDPATGTFSATGSMATGRVHGTASLLPDGKVLVAGGAGSLDRSAELYDPVTGTFSPAGDMVTARSYHTATLLPHGTVLLAGGYGSSAELYDPGTGTFAATGAMAAARSGHAATLLPDGKVLLSGGAAYTPFTTILDSAELYDPESGTFSTIGSLASPRSSPTATLLSNGTVLIVGGSTITAAELYHPLASDPTGYALDITITGSGTGSVNSVPAGASGDIACSGPPPSGVCVTTQPAGALLNLRATPASDSLFGGWSSACGGCAGLSCLVIMNGDKSCAATFAVNPLVQSAGPIYYGSLTKAYQQVSGSAPATLKARAAELTENVSLDRTIALTLRGGYDPAFEKISGMTTINGLLTISRGSLTVDGIVVR